MKHLTRLILLTFVILTVFGPVFFVKTADAHYNILNVTTVTEYCIATLTTGPLECGSIQFIEFEHVYFLDDHVEVLDDNNNVVYAHKPGHQNHIQGAFWGLTRDDYVYVMDCSQCPN